MPAPATIAELLDLTRKSGVVDEKRLDAHLQKLTASRTLPNEPAKLAEVLVRDGILTNFQAEQLLQGKWRRFTIGKYKVLERLGSGGMGSVYLCEHKLMRRRVAVKVLPTAKAADPSSLERFYREARAVAALDHPNIVHAYDIDKDESLHFLVMEYVDGASLQELVKRVGPLDPQRAAHYILQTALGLEHANAAGLVHRDIKPGNILVDRTGVVKILDMGLARFFNDEEDILTKKYDENVLGTADYLAPEQALDSHTVDTRADIYSLGGTFYFLLTGRTPFGEGSIAQKLIWHQTRQPKSLTAYRNDLPPGLVAVIERMMAKDPARRYQLPRDLAEALTPWTQNTIAPPAEAELPRLSPAVTGVNPGEPSLAPSQPPSSKRKAWQVTAPGARPAAAPPAKPLFSPETRANSGGDAPTGRDPYPAPRRPLGRPAQATLEDEDSIPWEKVAAEAGRVHTEVESPRRPAPKRRQPSVQAAKVAMVAGSSYERREQWLFIWILVAVAAVLLGALAVGFVVFGVFDRLINGPPAKTSSTTPAREPLKVKKDGGEGYFPSVEAALRKAEAGDRIQLFDAKHQERLRLDGKEERVAQNVTIEPAPGVEVIWTDLPKNPDGDPLMDLRNLRHLRFHNLHFRGEDKLRKPITVSGHCPGLTFEKVTLEGFRETGMAFTSCTGGGDEMPVKLIGVTAWAKNDADAALTFGTYRKDQKPVDNEYIVIEGSCRFEGQYRVGKIQAKTPLSAKVIVPASLR